MSWFLAQGLTWSESVWIVHMVWIERADHENRSSAVIVARYHDFYFGQFFEWYLEVSSVRNADQFGKSLPQENKGQLSEPPKGAYSQWLILALIARYGAAGV